MHRNGILPQHFKRAYEKARQQGLRVEGLLTHFSSADELDASYFTQRLEFERVKERAKKLDENLLFHSHNSAALFRCKALAKDELCRVGLAQFGYSTKALRPVLSLYAHRLSSRLLKKGQCLGYGRAFCAPRDMRVATYDLGYADGLFRYDGQGELRLASGAAMLGRMSMDSFSCEDLGTRLCVFKDASVFARFFHTIEYEILSKLSPHIKRVLR